MNVNFLVTPEACQLAMAKLRGRKARAIDALEVIDQQHQANLLAYLQDQISDDELDDIQAEKARLQVLREEDHTELHQKLTDRKEQLRLAEIRQANLLASYQRRCEFAATYNSILQSVDGCDAKTMKHLKETRPGDLDSAAFWRFSSMMGEYVGLPVSKRKPYGQHCRCEPYTPSPLEK